MNNLKKILIYDFEELFDILNELKSELNIQIYKIDKIDNDLINDNLIISKTKIPSLENQITLKELPVTISSLLEKINVNILTNNYQNQSEFIIGKYKMNLNSREMILKKVKLKITEKEMDIIIFLFNSSNPVEIKKLQQEVWKYHSDLETHTVETHVYRLRKKILEKFKDNHFIISSKDGYEIK